MKFKSTVSISTLLIALSLLSCNNTIEPTTQLEQTDTLANKIASPKDADYSISTNFKYSPIPQLIGYVGDGFDSASGQYRGCSFVDTSMSFTADTMTAIAKGYTFVEDNKSVPVLIEKMLSDFTKSGNYKSTTKLLPEDTATKVTVAFVTIIKLHEISLTNATFTQYALDYKTSGNDEIFMTNYGNCYSSKVLLGGYRIEHLVATISESKSKSDIKKALYLKYKTRCGESLNADETRFMNTTLENALWGGGVSETTPIKYGFNTTDSVFTVYYSQPTELAVIGRQFSSYNNLP